MLFPSPSLSACTTLGNYTDDIYREVPIKNARTSVTISSPNFPQPYPQNIQCTWRVLAPPGYQVKLSFLTFELEQSYLRSGCHDYVSVRYVNEAFSLLRVPSPRLMNFTNSKPGEHLLKNKLHITKVLFNSFPMNGHTLGFCP